jgi:hypothetical protein
MGSVSVLLEIHQRFQKFRHGLGTLVGGMEVKMKEPNLIGEESNLISFVISYCLFFLKSNWIGL